MEGSQDNMVCLLEIIFRRSLQTSFTLLKQIDLWTYPEYYLLIMQKAVVVGVDIGSWTFKVSAFENQRFEILTNEANFRQTPSLVAFHHTERLVGQEAQIKLKSNYMNTVRAPLRLIGLQKSFELIEQELKCSPAKYDLGDQLSFSIQFSQDKKTRLQPEHFLISLMSKIYKIVSTHNLNPQGYYLTIPSYLSHYERKLIRRCGQIVLHSQKVTLIDDWLSLASDYAYHRVTDLKNNNRVVIFVDIGYSKCSFFAIEFNIYGARLLDCLHMRFLGSKNMDELLTQFYDKQLKEDRNSDESVFTSQKTIVKMLDHIEKQRKMLSANQDSPLHIQALYPDYDLSYNMKRGQLEHILEPVLNKIKKGLRSLKSRMPPEFKIFSIQLVGGTSRMPCVTTMIKEVFGMNPSRTLNLSEATARGATIYGAVSSNIIPLAYNLSNFNLIDICIAWHYTQQNDTFFGQKQSQYTEKRSIFAANSHVPYGTFIDFPASGSVELYIYYNQTVSTKSIGYLRFSTPNRINFRIDESKIVSAELQKGSFTVNKMQDKKELKWKDIQSWHRQVQATKNRITQIQLLKNELESKFYEIRGKLNEYITYMSSQEEQLFRMQFKQIQNWIQEENGRPLTTPEDKKLYSNQLTRIKSYEKELNALQARETKSKGIKDRFERLREAIDSIPASSLNQQQSKKMKQLVQWLKDSYAKMQQNQWDGYYLNDTFLAYAEQEFTRIVGMEAEQ